MRLTEDLLARLDGKAMQFLLSLHDAEPNFEVIGLPQPANLPAVRWKLLNFARLKELNPVKHAEQGQAIAGLSSSTLNGSLIGRK